MRELFSTVTSKGQVTIPVEIRRLLGVGPHDRIAFLVEDGHVRIVGTRSVVERTAGLLWSQEPPLGAKELREAAERAVAEEAVERSKG